MPPVNILQTTYLCLQSRVHKTSRTEIITETWHGECNFLGDMVATWQCTKHNRNKVAFREHLHVAFNAIYQQLQFNMIIPSQLKVPK